MIAGMRRGITILLVGGLVTAPLLAQTAPPQVEPGEIVIEGRALGERYRLPTDMRGPPPETRRAPAAADPRLACNGIGAYGCGTEVLPIVTVRGDGSVQIGATPEE